MLILNTLFQQGKDKGEKTMARKKQEAEQMNEVTTRQDTAIQQVNIGQLEGFENVDLTKDIKYPRVKLMQKMSPELDENEALRAGMMVNSVTLEQVGANFIPLMISKSNIFFVPRDADKWAPILQAIPTINKEDFEGELAICRAMDAKTGDRFGNCATCPYSKFHGKNAPLCTETINVMVLFDGDFLPSIISFSVTSLKHGKNFINLALMKSMREGSLFASKYKWTAKKNSNAKGDWYELTVQPIAEKPSEEELAFAREMYLMVKDYVVSVDAIVDEQVSPQASGAESEY